MQKYFRLFFEQVAGILKRLDVSQKITLSLLSTLVVISLVVIAIWGSAPDYEVLYTGLAPADAGEIVKKLDAQKVKYRISGKGDAIEVPRKEVYQLRLSLATEGLPKGSGVGFELFDTFKLGITDFTQKVNYQRALEAELAKTIGQMGQIKMARVHLVLPDEQVFVDEKEEASASVILDLVGASQLSEAQVNGLVHFISTSVKGLKPNNITVVDTKGNLLFSQSDDDQFRAAGITDKQYDVQRRFEKSIESSLQGMLTKIFGPNNAVVRVNLDLDFDENKTDSEMYEPAEEPLLRSQKMVEESFQGQNAAPPANAGVNSQFSGSGGNNNSNSNYSKIDDTKNFEITKHIKHTIQAPGKIKKLSVAVVLDRVIDEPQQNALGQALSAAAGIVESRGDKLIVRSIPFDKSLIEKDKKEMKQAITTQKLIEGAKTVGIIALAGITFFYIRRTLKSVAVTAQVQRPQFEYAAATHGSVAQSIVPPVMDMEPDDPEEQKRKMMQQGLVDMVDLDAKAFTQMLKRWLNEDL